VPDGPLDTSYAILEKSLFSQSTALALTTNPQQQLLLISACVFNWPIIPQIPRG